MEDSEKVQGGRPRCNSHWAFNWLSNQILFIFRSSALTGEMSSWRTAHGFPFVIQLYVASPVAPPNPMMAKKGKVIFRRPRTTDVDQLLEIERKCFRAHRFSRRQFRYYIQANSGIFAVAEAQGSVVAYIAGTVLRRRPQCTARLYSMAVLPQWRGLGIGTALLTYFERHAARHKCSSVVLQVRQGNRHARTLYQDFGYELEAVLSGYYGPGKTGLRLRKDLKGGP